MWRKTLLINLLANLFIFLPHNMTPPPPKMLGNYCFKCVLSNHDSTLLAEKVMVLVPAPRTSCKSVMALQICSYIAHTTSEQLEKKFPDFALQPSTTSCTLKDSCLIQIEKALPPKSRLKITDSCKSKTPNVML